MVRSDVIDLSEVVGLMAILSTVKWHGARSKYAKTHHWLMDRIS